MIGSGDIEPGRLAALVDGAAPRDAGERELVALLASTRALEDGAPERLRARVAARRRPSSRRRIVLVAAPIAAALLAAAVAVPVLTTNDARPPAAPAQGAAPESSAAAPATPGARPAASLTVRVGGEDEIARASASATAIVRGLGGALVGSGARETTGEGSGRRLAFRVPAARAPDAIDAFAMLGAVVGPRGAAADATAGGEAGTVTLILALTTEAGPGGG